MSAQPIEEDPQDPQVILRGLPVRERPEFLRQYRQAVEAARDDLASYTALKRLLHRWHLTVIATNRPGYYDAIQEAKEGAGATTPLDEAIADELARRR
ncbi:MULTISPECIES: DUF6247 family protein [Acrocarpospora]|uniref:Uncharacterized protein n=2 Tax=Acrocarpospora TaxID=90974 RepID=A0A5M3XYK2_9ACTN|nr:MULTISPECIES: DUF6247 family protein [Acrocarpospora]GES24651.1 hypothetical protein Aple_075500 [Acrocarpospora pleiomorpha]